MTTPRKLSARYELGEILGFGGMSEVHKGKDLRLERDVAIKVLRADLARDPTFYLRFKREAQNAAALNHPAIVAVYDTGEAESDDGTQLPYIVMEYVDGETLRDIVRSKGPMPSRRAMEVIADTCAALDFSHRHGIIHRDIKPANIMINKAGAVKVMDFGIARAIADSSSPMTQTAAVIGTAQYLSPEQARGETVDPRSDVYSLGCVLYEILTGQPPFTGDSPVAVAYQHVREDPEPPSLVYSGVPRELDSIILKAMAKNPANRYQTAAEMRSDIIRVLGGQKPAAPTVMTDEDRTTILGSLDSSPRRFKTDGSDAPRVPVSHAARPDTGESPNRRRTIRIAVLVIAAIGVIALVGGFLVRQSGADQIGIPDVAGQPALQAQSTLKGLGFKVETSEKFDNLVASGNVIATRPLADSRIPEGSTVTLEVSKGPESVQVPKLSGLTQTQAQQVLEAQGLRLDPSIQKAPSSTAEVDHITEQEPSAGSNVKIDSTVKITIGSGPEQVRIPNVVGQTIDVAQPNLEGAGFKVEIEQIVSAKAKGEVVSTSPAGGTSADKGSSVRVQVSQGDQIPMPDLNGKSVSDALAALRSAGWSGTADQLQQSPQATLVPEQVGRVLSQAPAPGSQVSRTAAIQVGIGAFAFGR